MQKKKAYDRYVKNANPLPQLQSGDIIEYSRFEEVTSEDDIHWAIYIGYGYIMRFDRYMRRIVYESYWNIANRYYLTADPDLDHNYFSLPVAEILNRAYYAYQYAYYMNLQFSSDKNFVMWCRYNINKSDIEFSTESSSVTSKQLIIKRFCESIQQTAAANRKKKSGSVESTVVRY
jgi:hypothetical protein